MSPTTHVTVGHDDEFDQLYFYRAEPGDTEGNAHAFDGAVPTELVERAEASIKAYHEAVEAMAEAIGYDAENGGLKQPCAEWQGTEHTMRGWWVVRLASEGEEEWPIRDVGLNHFDSEAEAAAWIETLPDPVHFVVHRHVVTVDKARLTVERGSEGWTTVSSCEHCGRERKDHAA